MLLGGPQIQPGVDIMSNGRFWGKGGQYLDILISSCVALTIVIRGIFINQLIQIIPSNCWPRLFPPTPITIKLGPKWYWCDGWNFLEILNIPFQRICVCYEFHQYLKDIMSVCHNLKMREILRLKLEKMTRSQD